MFWFVYTYIYIYLYIEREREMTKMNIIDTETENRESHICQWVIAKIRKETKRRGGAKETEWSFLIDNEN